MLVAYKLHKTPVLFSSCGSQKSQKPCLVLVDLHVSSPSGDAKDVMDSLLKRLD